MKWNIMILSILLFSLALQFILPIGLGQENNLTVEEQLREGTRMGFEDFFFSNIFIVFWIVVGLFIVTTPFAIAGISRLWGWYDLNFRKPKGGFIKVKQKLPNDRVRELFVKPTGKFISYNTYDDKELTIPWRNEKGWISYEGRILTIFLDEGNKQINLANAGVKNQISQEEITMGYKSAYETGKLIGSLDLMSDLKKWLIILLFVVGVFGLINGVLTYQTMRKIGNIHFPSGEEVAMGMINATAKMQQAQYNQTMRTDVNVPTVG